MEIGPADEPRCIEIYGEQRGEVVKIGPANKPRQIGFFHGDEPNVTETRPDDALNEKDWNAILIVSFV
jgi:hypothetical protein